MTEINGGRQINIVKFNRKAKGKLRDNEIKNSSIAYEEISEVV